MTVKVLTDYFSEELKAQAHPHTGEKMSAYMKNHFAFYGVPSPARRAILTNIWKQEKSAFLSHIRPLTQELWIKDQREYQMIALDLMGKSKKVFKIEDLPLLEYFITTKSWWDTVDFLASTMIGHILKGRADEAEAVAERYMSSDNMWLQRTALIFQLKYKDETDEALLYRLIDQTTGSKEFFINKASGWALRQYSKFQPASVEQYISDNREKLAKLTIKEGSKYL